MPLLSQSELSRRMRDQLKILDPEISAEPGTPERKIIDITAQAIAEANVDVFVQSYQYDVDTRVGQDLDDFLALFGMDRQAAKRATGRVTFSRGTPAPAPVLIPAGTQVSRPATAVSPQIIFQTVLDAVIPQGGIVTEVPVEAVAPGSSGNVPANTITSILSTVSNISGVTNDNATNNGRDDENDSEFKTRFKRTVLRNIAGTQDQFIAIAIASIFTSKATILGPMSRFSEYLQIDSAGNAVSNNPHSKYIYDYDYYLSTNGTETSDIYYPNVDYFFNITAGVPNITITPALFAKPTVAPTAVITSDNGLLSGRYRWAYTFVYSYTASDGTEILGESTLSPETDELIVEGPTTVQVTVPVGGGTVLERRIYRNINDEWFRIGEITNNIDTLFIDNNVILGDPPPKASLESGEVAYFEHSYVSQNSRNIIDEDNDIYILNKIDLYISGEDIVTAKDVIVGPSVDPADTNTLFTGTTTSKYYNQNYVRDFDGDAPSIGNSLVELLWTPVIDLPDSMTIGNATYILNQDYFLVRDISNLRNSFRARDGIEMRSSMATAVTGSRFVIEYAFNRLPLLVNQIAEEHKQTTQDVLVHGANNRYFNTNLVVMYERGAIKQRVDDEIEIAIERFFRAQDFGAVIQMSDITSVVHNVQGVDNVRIATSADNPTKFGIQEVNASGNVLDQLPFTNDFILGDIDLPYFNALGPTDDGPIQRTQNTWTTGF
jgi:uncharacterized phage protein gp47/JayE